MNDDPVSGGRSPWQPPVGASESVKATERFRARQRSGARALALALGLFVILVFAISIVKIRNGG